MFMPQHFSLCNRSPGSVGPFYVAAKAGVRISAAHQKNDAE
jgi:hypothetical protein